MNEKLLAALTDVTEANVPPTEEDVRAFLYVAAASVVRRPELARAWRDALNEHVPANEEKPLDFPRETPAELLFGDGTAPTTAPQMAAHPGRYAALTRAQVNALCEAAGLTGNWSKPRPLTWTDLWRKNFVIYAGSWQTTDKGRDWLKAAGLLK